MRTAVASLLVLAAFTAVLLVGDGREAAGETGTPVPTQDPVVLTVRYSFEGKPLIAPLVGPILLAYVNGVECGRGVGLLLYETIVQDVSWPMSLYPQECRASPATVRLCEHELNCSTEAYYEGESMVVDYPMTRLSEYFRLTTAQFRNQGAPVSVSVRSWEYSANGRACQYNTYAFLGIARDISELVRVWGDGASACGLRGQTIDVVFDTVEYGEVTGQFVWNGEDVSFEVDVPGAPTLSPVPSATPLPTAYPYSPIVIEFVHKGRPVEVTVGQDPSTVIADGVNCSGIALTVAVTIKRGGMGWPRTPEDGLPRECTKGPPTHLIFQWATHGGHIGAEFDWLGGPVHKYVEVPDTAKFAYLDTTPTPVPSPAALPRAGGPPGGGASVWPWALAIVLCAAAAFVVARLRGAS